MAYTNPNFDSYSKQTQSQIERLRSFIGEMRPGDRFILYVLLLFVLISSVRGIYALEKRYLIEVPAHGGSLTEGVLGAPRFINPILAISDTDHDLAALTYAGLMGYDPGGALIPVLAESYEISPDGKTYTFVLREEAVFSDGTALTSEDVVFTVEKTQDPKLKSPEFQNWSQITAEAIDARTVQFTLPKAYTPFLEDATLGILPFHVWKDVTVEEFPFSPKMLKPVGAGPFTFASLSQDANGVITSYTLVSFPDFALGRPYLDEIQFNFYGELGELQTALEDGSIESAFGILGENPISSPYSRIFGVFFNPVAEPLFARSEVRKALSLAIDRDALVRDILGGYGTPSIGPVPEGFGITPLTLPPIETRIADAKEVLTTAGWNFDDATSSWTKKDKKTTVTLAVTLKTGNVPELKALANVIQKNWLEIGVPTTIELYSATELTQDVIRPRKYGALLFGEVIGTSPDLYAFWSSSERSDPGLNISNYSNKKADTLLEEIRTEINGSPEQTASLTALQALISSEYPAAFTHTPDFVYSVPNELQGVVLSHVSSPSDRFKTVSAWYKNTELVWPFLLKN